MGRSLYGPLVTVKATGGVGSSDAHCGFPSCVKMPGGTLIASWRQATNHNIPASASDSKFMKATSSDNGATWSAPSLLYADAIADVRTHCTAVDPVTGDLLMIYYVDDVGVGLVSYRSHTFFRRSTDAGNSWGAAVALLPAQTGYGADSTAVTDLFVVRDATASYGYTLYTTLTGVDSTATDDDARVFYTRLAKSKDGGVTWTPHAVVALNSDTPPPYNAEGQTIVLDTGRWLCVMRDDTDPTRTFWASHSDTAGLTWSTPVQILTSITNEPKIWQTPQGDVVLMGEHQWSGTDYYFSLDRGASWASGGQLSGLTSTGIGGKWVQMSDTNTAAALGVCWGEEIWPDTASVYFRTLTALPANEVITSPPGTLVVSAPFVQNGHTLTVAGVLDSRTVASATAYSVLGGTMRLAGADASRFSFSSDGSTWASTLALVPGFTALYVSVLPVSGDATLTAQILVPL